MQMSREQHPAFRQPRRQDGAACRPYPTWWWFSFGRAETVEAFLICTSCTVRAECLDFALDHFDLIGIWAATTHRERVQLRASSRPPTASQRPESEPDSAP